jgi:hypothetical protein
MQLVLQPTFFTLFLHQHCPPLLVAHHVGLDPPPLDDECEMEQSMHLIDHL